MVTLYGHRGAKGEAPENTLPGFAHAYRAGVRAFELDVRLIADGEAVVLHDATVDRTTDGTGAVSGMTLAEVAALDARGAFPDWPEPCRIPTLAEVLAALPGDVLLEVEVKHDEPARLERLARCVVTSLRDHELWGRVTVSSFDPEALRILRRLAPEFPRAFIAAYDSPASLAAALDLGCAQCDIPLATGSARAVAAAHAAGLRVTGWPGNTPEQLETLLGWGVDGITSDHPGVALPLLHRRAQAGR